MYHRERRKMRVLIILGLVSLAVTQSTNDTSPINNGLDDTFDNNIIDFDEHYSVKFNKNYGAVPWNSNDNFNRESHRYTVFNDKDQITLKNTKNKTEIEEKGSDVRQEAVEETTTSESDYNSIPAELLSTTVDPLVSIVESTVEPDLSVIPLMTAKPNLPEVIIKQTVTLPPSTQIPDTTPDVYSTTTDQFQSTTNENTESPTTKYEVVFKPEVNVIQNPVSENSSTVKPFTDVNTNYKEITTEDRISSTGTDSIVNQELVEDITTENRTVSTTESTTVEINVSSDKNTTNKFDELTNFNVTESTKDKLNTSTEKINDGNPKIKETDKAITNNTTKHKNSTTAPKTQKETKNKTADKDDSLEAEVPIFTGLDTEEEVEVPEDYYDSKDVLPTSMPKTDALSVIFGLAGSVVESVVESVAERVVPKGIFDLFKRMQKQSEALEAERLRSREENGGLGQFGRGLLKSISTGLSRPLSQLMARDARDVGSLDNDRGFVTSVSTGVASAATTLAEAFKDRVQAIYPGTVWCGDGHAASARSGELGLFFFTDTCCRQHDACKLFIRAGDTKYGLTNTGLFTRSHCSCDTAFRECLRRTNSLVSGQIGLTYFNVLGPQCFRKAHPIVRCMRRTRITGQKCEEYELDFTKPKMWQWFDNETF